MAEEKKHPVSYIMTIAFHEDGVGVTLTGESVEFTKEEGCVVRPRHLKIASEISKMMHDFIKSRASHG